MKIAIIGTRGWSYAGMEDLVRELGPRFVRDGHEVTIHAWATDDTIAQNVWSDTTDGVKRVFHRTTRGKFTGQMIIAIKSSWISALSDYDIIYCAFIQNGIYMWLPRLFKKKILSNVDGMMWKDPKWPIIFRHVFFPIGAYLTILFSNKTVTDSFHMQELYRKKFKVNLDWIGYGCSPIKPERRKIDLVDKYPEGYYIIMSRITPHNLTDLMIDGFIKSGTRSHLLIAGHIPESKWFLRLKEKAEGKNVTFLGLIKDQEYLNQVLLNSRAYLHGHSLGGINPALVRVTGMDKPVICVDTVFNREVIKYPNNKLQACVFFKSTDSVSKAIQTFENDEEYFSQEATKLGIKIREIMSWDKIYEQYKKYFMECLGK